MESPKVPGEGYQPVNVCFLNLRDYFNAVYDADKESGIFVTGMM